ncbi:65-kDa microtubule-associated protein 4-like isoform X2 [Tripterygium wilfordii]|nr:65-kDa microtubule-associated protein 4-like isoform X2 [Tripterygium wilfordii]
MLNNCNNLLTRIETACGSLLSDLEKIWDEVGESDSQRDAFLLEIEQECLEVYRRKAEKAKESKSQLQKSIAASKAEITNISAALGDEKTHFDLKAGRSLKEELQSIIALLEDMKKRRADRKNQFIEVREKLRTISNEIFRSTKNNLHKIDDNDLSIRKLEELQRQFRELQNEKRNRLNQVLEQMDSLNSLCMVLGMNFKCKIREIHPTLDDPEVEKDITDDTIKRLGTTIQSLREIKIQRMQRLQELGTSLLELWNMMDIPIEEQCAFHNVTSNVAALEPEITEPNMLSMDFINQVKEEVTRLEQLKSSKMKEIVSKKMLVLEEMCRKTHMVTEALSALEYSVEAIESGSVDPVLLLERIDLQIAKVREEAFSRKEILEKVDKWLAACEEESWLEEYNRDDNRYNAGRGSHLALKRAEKARTVLNKIPAMVETMTLKVKAWEKERGIHFLYDGGRLLSMLVEYGNLRQEKEQERLRQRDQKRLQVQLIAEQEVLFGSKPSPTKSGKKTYRTPSGVASDRKFSLGGALFQNLKAEKVALSMHRNKRADCRNQVGSLNHQQSGGFAPKSSGKRNSEIAGHLVKKHSSRAMKTCEIQSPLIRKPLSPVSSSMMASKANIANFIEDQGKTQNGLLQTTIPNIKKQMVTPSRPVFVSDEENKTPMTMPIPVPTTPLTSIPMLVATTPATPAVSLGPKRLEHVMEQIECSFEEVRLSFVRARAQS